MKTSSKHVKEKKVWVLCGLILSLTTTLPVAAGVTAFVDRDAWSAGLGGRVDVDDFSRESQDDHQTPFVTSRGVMFTALSGGPITIEVDDDGLVNGSRDLHFRDFAAGVEVELSHESVGFGFEYVTAIEPWTVEVGGSTVDLQPSSSGFIGFLGEPEAIRSFVMKGGSGAQGGISIDNLSTVGFATAGELHNEGVQYVLENLDSLPPPAEVNEVVVALMGEYCATIDEDCSWLQVPDSLPRDPRPLIRQLGNSHAFRNRAQAVFSIIEIRGQRPQNARSLNRFEHTLGILESSYRRPLEANGAAQLSDLVSVARSSGRFWASTREGGVDGVRFLPDRGGPSHPPAAIDWPQVVLIDSLGCVAGVELGGGLIGCIVTGAAWSTIEVIRQNSSE